MTKTPTDSIAIDREFQRLKGTGISPSISRYIDWLKDTIIPEYVKNDQAAQMWQKRYHFVIKSIQFISVSIILLVISQALFFHELHELLWIEVVLICIMFLLYTAGKKGDYHMKWLKYRFFAEKLRCCMFTFILYDLTEIKEILHRETTFLISNEVRSEWKEIIDPIIKHLESRGKPIIDTNQEFGNIKNFIGSLWLNDQLLYHKRKMTLNHNRYKTFEQAGITLLIVTFIAAIFDSIGIGAIHEQSHGLISNPGSKIPHPFPINKIFIVIAIVFPSITAALHAIANSLEMHKLGFRSRLVTANLLEMNRKLNNISSPDALRDFLVEVTEFFTREHEEWHSIIALNEPVVA